MSVKASMNCLKAYEKPERPRIEEHRRVGAIEPLRNLFGLVRLGRILLVKAHVIGMVSWWLTWLTFHQIGTPR